MCSLSFSLSLAVAGCGSPSLSPSFSSSFNYVQQQRIKIACLDDSLSLSRSRPPLLPRALPPHIQPGPEFFYSGIAAVPPPPAREGMCREGGILFATDTIATNNIPEELGQFALIPTLLLSFWKEATKAHCPFPSFFLPSCACPRLPRVINDVAAWPCMHAKTIIRGGLERNGIGRRRRRFSIYGIFVPFSAPLSPTTPTPPHPPRRPHSQFASHHQTCYDAACNAVQPRPNNTTTHTGSVRQT